MLNVDWGRAAVPLCLSADGVFEHYGYSQPQRAMLRSLSDADLATRSYLDLLAAARRDPAAKEPPVAPGSNRGLRGANAATLARLAHVRARDMTRRDEKRRRSRR